MGSARRPRSPAPRGGLAPREGPALLGIVVLGFVALGVSPRADRLTWLMENAPVLVALPWLLATRRTFPLTAVAYRLLALHAFVLMLGGHYTYAEVPLGDWVGEWAGWQRNHYDRLGHFMQGFSPAILVRELLVRRAGLVRRGWLFAVVLLVGLGISAVYELLEWWAALLTEDGAVAFLGTQGDVWDTQWDMFLCGVGAACAQLALERIHDRQLPAGL